MAAPKAKDNRMHQNAKDLMTDELEDERHIR